MKRKYLILFSLSGLILTCDQLTKHLVHTMLMPGQFVEVIPSVFSIVHLRNTGFIFGNVQQVPQSLQHIFFIGIPVFALILIVLIFIKLQDNQMITSVALTTILAGAVGNLIDRSQFGYVIDFIELHAGEFFYLPPFNVADCSIIVGVSIMFFNTLFQPKAKESQPVSEGES